MSYTKLDPQPALRDPASSDIAAPGIYPNEVVVQLDTGELVAVGCERSWQENNAGLAFYTWGRVVNADGSTKLSGASEIVIEVRDSSSSEAVTAHGADALATQRIMAVLGEPLAHVPIPNPDPLPAPQTLPMIPWDQTYLANVSVRVAIHAVSCAGDVTGLAALI
jgi:hypothetical protein